MARTPKDSGLVRAREAREHNLKDIDVGIPTQRVTRNALVVFTGVSGSGKHSVAFGTLTAASCAISYSGPYTEKDKKRNRSYSSWLPRDFWKFRDGNPELLNGFHNLGQHINAVRLRNIAVRMVAIRIVNVFISI